MSATYSTREQQMCLPPLELSLICDLNAFGSSHFFETTRNQVYKSSNTIFLCPPSLYPHNSSFCAHPQAYKQMYSNPESMSGQSSTLEKFTISSSVVLTCQDSENQMIAGGFEMLTIRHLLCSSEPFSCYIKPDIFNFHSIFPQMLRESSFLQGQ